MKRLLTLLCLAAALIFPLSVSAEPAGSPQERIDLLTRQYRAYQQELQVIVDERRPLPEYFMLLQELDQLEKELEAFGIYLASLPPEEEEEEEEEEVVQQEFGITLSQGSDYDRGNRIESGARLTSEDGYIWAVSPVIFPDSETPQKFRAEWQLLDRDNDVQGTKVQEFEGSGGSDETFTKIPLASFSNGMYAFSLTVTPLENPKKTQKAKATFLIYRPIKIREVWATDKQGSTENKTRFTPDEVPHLYCTFDMDKSMQEVHIEFAVTDAKSGKQLYSMPIEYGYASDKDIQRSGVQLPEGVVKPGDTVTFTATISPPVSSPGDFAPLSASLDFSVVSPELKVRASRVLLGDQTGNYSITVPDWFEEPFSVRIAGGGLKVNQGANPLQGTLQGALSTIDTTHTASFMAKDGKGQVAKGTATVVVRGVDQRTIDSKRAPQQILSKTPPPQEPAYTEPVDNGNDDFLQQLQDIQNTYNQEMQKIKEQEKRDQEAIKQKYSTPPRSPQQLPSWAQPNNQQPQQRPQSRSYKIDVSACESAYYSCMKRCPTTGGHDVISSCHMSCGSANSSCMRAKCPGGSIYGVGWNITCTVKQ